MELRHLRHLAALAETGSFYQAARRLGLRQPALSQSIRSLESDIGVELVLRSSSGSHLTRAGNTFLNEARHILAALDSAITTARAVAVEGAMPFRLGIAADAATGYTMRALQAFSRESDCRLIVRDALPSRLLAMLDDGRLDLALVPFSASQRSVAIEPLWVEDVNIIFSINHILATESTVDIRGLVDELVVIEAPENENGIVRIFLDACQDLGVKLNNTALLQRQEARLAVVGAGIGVAVQTSSNQRFLSALGIVTRPLVPPLTITIAAAFPASGMTPLAQQFIEITRFLKDAPDMSLVAKPVS